MKREVFSITTSESYTSVGGLLAQTGQDRKHWRHVALKELIDNALDAADNAGIAPVLSVELSGDFFTVADNGPGLPLAMLEGSLDYSARVSDKLGYVSPSRGQQGNALKTLWTAPFVAQGAAGYVEVETAAYRVAVRVTVDAIEQEPAITVEDLGAPGVKTGTRITVHWPELASSPVYRAMRDFYMAAADFNPHATIIGTAERIDATAPDWPHWRPDRPTAPHWYTTESLRTLVALLLNAERRGARAKSVGEFIRDFHGLTGTGKAKAVAAQSGLTGAMLRDLVESDDINIGKLRGLLSAMQAASRPVKPELLGVLGEAHAAATLVRHGAAPDSVQYRRSTGEADGLPYVLEVAFGVKLDEQRIRTLSVGINYSPAIAQPFSPLAEALADARCTMGDPVVLLLHLVCPVIRFIDRGKSRAVLPSGIAEAVKRLVKLVTARFTTAKRQADRQDRMESRALDELRNANRQRPMTVKAAAWRVMERAYMKASNGNTLPANARQVMYAARPDIIALTGKPSPWKNSGTFTQGLLNDFIAEHPELCADWDVVFDDRGHFAEPHTRRAIGVGTLAVRGYIHDWSDQMPAPDPVVPVKLPSCGPALRYRFVLFIEKEGFTHLLQRARIAERYDIAIMSTKGMSTTAARHLVERLSDAGVTVLVMRDFDRAGFTIVSTLRSDTRRYQFKTPPKVIDIGLRLDDVQDLGLDGEETIYKDAADPRPKLLASGATDEEARYLVTRRDAAGHWIGRRVELNAMNSQQLIHWLEAKLEEHGVKKFVPAEPAMLRAAWQRAWRIAEINRRIAELLPTIQEAPDAPADLVEQVAKRMAENPNIAWDDALLTPG